MMHRSARSKLAAAMGIAACAALASQSALASAQLTERTGQRPQFGAAVNRVLVDVTVVDEDGRFVHGLTREDFTVLEEGSPVDLSFFALERFSEETFLSEDGAGDPKVAAIAAETPLLPRYVVLFIDGFNTGPSDWERVRFALRNYLDNGARPNDRFLLATLTPRRKLLVAPDFTNDIETLKKTMDELATNPFIKERRYQHQQDLLRTLYDTEGLGIGASNVADPSLADEVSFDVEANSLRQGASLAQVFAGERKDEVLYTISAMTSLAAHLSTTFDVPGPKTMVMVSAGISRSPGSLYYYILDQRADQASAQARVSSPSASSHPVAFRSPFAQTIESDLLRAIGQLNRLNYTLYTIGAQGSGAALLTDNSSQMRSNLSTSGVGIAFRDEQEGLRMLADGTGGLAFDNSENFGMAFDRIARDTAYRYVLGYTPPERDSGSASDKFYRIRVEVGRDDVSVRARRGYVDG